MYNVIFERYKYYFSYFVIIIRKLFLKWFLLFYWIDKVNIGVFIIRCFVIGSDIENIYRIFLL